MAKTEFKISVAPMMDWTDRHCRWFHRRLSKRTWLYTEMVVADALIHGDRERLAGFDASEHPVALQIGGSIPEKLAEAARIGEGFGYDEININIGCPSDRVQSGRFGACLMAEPHLVAKCYATMAKAVNVPVTVKCRLGIDDQNIDQTLPEFIEIVSKEGCTEFIVHARKAWLKGLSPKDNRTIPPLNYGKVREMKYMFPDLAIILNGGLETSDMAMREIQISDAMQSPLDGFMIGRSAYHEPWGLTEIDENVFGDMPFPHSREDIAEKLIGYAVSKEAADPSTKAIIRHVMGLFHGQPGARKWRRDLSEGLGKGDSPSKILSVALNHRLKMAA